MRFAHLATVRALVAIRCQYQRRQGEGALHNEIQSIMGKDHTGTLSEQKNRQTPVKTLPSRNFIGGR